MKKTKYFNRQISIALICTFSILSFNCKNENTTEPESFGDVVGNVFEVGTSMPISGVLVQISGRSTVTSSDGAYKLSNVPVGDQILSATKSDYEIYQVNILIKKNETSEYDIPLTSSIAKARVFGNVRNSQNQPIQNIKISIDQLYDFTDASGVYQLPTVPQGIRTIMADENQEYHGFESQLYLSSIERQYDISLTKKLVEWIDHYYTIGTPIGGVYGQYPHQFEVKINNEVGFSTVKFAWIGEGYSANSNMYLGANSQMNLANDGYYKYNKSFYLSTGNLYFFYTAVDTKGYKEARYIESSTSLKKIEEAFSGERLVKVLQLLGLN